MFLVRGLLKISKKRFIAVVVVTAAAAGDEGGGGGSGGGGGGDILRQCRFFFLAGYSPYVFCGIAVFSHY